MTGGPEWIPPSPRFRRPHVYALMVLLVGVAIAQSIVGARAFAGGGYPTYDEFDAASVLDIPETLPPTTVVLSRDTEAFAEGFEPEIAWHETQIESAIPHRLTIDAFPGYTYRVLGRGEEGCDLDARISDTIYDTSTSSDVLLDFHVQSFSTVAVEFSVYAAGAACTVGVGVYRR